MQFTVENLGKVSKADIDLKPLTIFIGKNGSGKTYVASALWAYVSYIRSIENDVGSFVPKEIYTKYSNKISVILDKILNTDTSNLNELILINKDDVKTIYDFINGKIDINTIIASCFNHNNFNNFNLNLPQISIGDVDISFYSKTTSYKIYNEDNLGREYEQDVDIESIVLVIKEYENVIFQGILSDGTLLYIDALNSIVEKIIYSIIEYLFLWKKSNYFSPVLYIPAARTGLMFGLHNFANTSLEQQNHFGVKKYTGNRNYLTAPLNDFISKLHKEAISVFSLSNSENQKPLLDKLIDGKINVNSQDRNFKYIPKSLNQELPLSASSSLVTETAVLSIFNYYIGEGSFVIFEEPEAHLHLSAQREMAKLIVKMINQGCHMLITTHSDTFLQQLNNLIMLNKLSENNPDILQEFNIEPDETIAGEKVAVYDFQYQDDDKTIAQPLELGDYGFIAPSVNDEINNLISQTDTIIDKIDDLKSNGE